MRNPYSTYRGRKSWLRRILISIVILLVIALVAAIVGLFVLPNYVVYTPNGPQLVLPFFGGGKTTPPPSPTPDATQDPAVIIDQPDPTPEPTPAPTPIPEMLPRRDAPLGLVSYEFPRLLDGSAKESLAAGRGAVFEMTESRNSPEEVDDPDAVRAANQDLPYSAAWVSCFGALGTPEAYGEERIERCKTMAGLGFDEIIVANTDYSAWLEANGEDYKGVTADEAQVTAFYADLRAALDDLGYEGYLSVACPDKETFTKGLSEGGQSGEAVAQYFDRVYVPGGNWNGFNLYKYLKDNGFQGTTADIVTVVSKPLSANYSWAILP